MPLERALGPAERAQGPFHRYGTAPWPQIKWFLGGMEQNPGRGRGEVFGRTQMELREEAGQITELPGAF